MCDEHRAAILARRGPVDGYAQTGPLDYCRATELKDEWSWGAWDVIAWKGRAMLPDWLGGDPDVLKRYKNAWVHAHADTIIQQARVNGISPILLAGVCWIEVGGDPDWIDAIAYPVRTFDHSADPLLEPLTITRKPELTSMGDVSIQLRRAAEAAGLDFNTLDAKQKDELVSCLSDEDVNIAFVARHLAQLKKIDKQCFTENESLRILGARYNRGPHLSLEQIRANTSYGDLIVKKKAELEALIKP